LPSTRAGETLRMAQSQVKMKLSSCVIVPTMTGDFRSGARRSERSKLKRAEREKQKDSDRELARSVMRWIGALDEPMSSTVKSLR
jgi:hypothetical protein